MMTRLKDSLYNQGDFEKWRLVAAAGTKGLPTETVLYSGLHNYVFVDKGSGVLEPREVTTGKNTSEYVEIMSGLQENEKVVRSGQFLLSAEAQLRSALPKWKKE